jgi:hypothetical protein
MQQPQTTNPQASTGFRPHRIRDLSVANHVVVLFCLLLDVFVAWHFYSPLLDNGWADFDDDTWRRDAQRRDTLGEIFDPMLRTGHEAMDTSYVPVQSLIYHLSVNVLRQEAWPIRVLGIWVHLLNAILVFVLAFRFTRSIPASHLASLAFLVYPRNAAAVAWLCASLAHGLVLSLYLGAFVLLQSFLHRREGRWRRGWWRWALALVLFALAVTTKELSATLFGAALLYDVLVVTGLRSLWTPWRKWREWAGLVARHGAFGAVVAAAMVVQSMKYDTGFVATKFGGMEFGARNPLRLLELATLLLHTGSSWSDEGTFRGMLVVAVALMAGLWLARRNAPVLFLVLWAPLILTPFTISNFREVQELGRYLYECTAVVAVLLATVAVAVGRRLPALGWPATVVTFLVLSVWIVMLGRVVG